MTKLHKVINSCTTLGQLHSASKYMALWGGITTEDELVFAKRLSEISRSCIRNIVEYTANGFDEEAKQELKRIEL